jgi:hypothetical protein
VPRRVSLPGADELFRTTGGAALQAPQPRQHSGDQVPSDARLRPVTDEEDEQRRARVRDDGQGPAARGVLRQDRADRPEGPGRGEDRPEHGGRDSGPNTSVPGVQSAATGLAPAPGGTAQGAQAAGSAAVHRPLTAAAPPTVTAMVTPQVPAQTPVAPVSGMTQPAAPARRKAPRQNRRPSGRERHDEKITVYVSAEELMDLEHARLVLRGEHGLAIDRGRIVREAVAVVLADLESRGEASILVRRLRGR